MTDIKSTTSHEPVLTTGTITALVAAALTLLVAFGFDLSEEQTVSITGFVAVVAPLVAAFVTRRQVTPASEVVVKVNQSGDHVAADALVGTPNGEAVTVV